MICSRCHDRGFMGGGLPGEKYESPWRWCSCPVAAELRDRQPELINQSNAAREKLIRLFPGKAQIVRLAEAVESDGYSGDF